MVKEELTDEEKKELERMREEVSKPSLEKKEVPLIKNIYQSGGKKISQYKINVPKKYADIIGLDKGKHKAKAFLDKENNKITLEISKDD